jgi:hypothetical protein
MKVYIDRHPEQPTIFKELDFDDVYPSIIIPDELTLGVRNSTKSPKRINRKYSSQWLPGDSEERYDKDIANGIKHTYKKDEFYYQVNANGFRCDDFDTMDFSKKSIIYLGCSHSFGMGVPEEHIWTVKVHTMLQREHDTTYNYINLGVPGGGLDWYLHFLPYFGKFNPAFIISATPEITRMNMIYDDGRISQQIPTRDNTMSEKDHAYSKLVNMGDSFFEYRKKLVFANINSTATLLDATFIEHGAIELFNSPYKYHDIARDNSHPNKFLHKEFANCMMNKIKGNQ